MGVENAMKPLSNAFETHTSGNLPVAYPVTTSDIAVKTFPETLRPHLGKTFSDFDGQVGYFNPQGGWAEARNATFAVLNEARRFGANIVSNFDVVELIYKLDNQGGRYVCGVKAADGRECKADRIILAAGSWTESLLERLGLSVPSKLCCQPSAQSVVTLKLGPDVAKLFRGTPVTYNMKTGMYTFEPNADGILKCAIHDSGVMSPNPRDFSHTEFPRANDSPHITKMVTSIQSMFPVLQFDGSKKNAEILYTRYCWYCDTADENFLIDFYPGSDNLLVTSGDSGHGFKFLPLLGRLITSRLFSIYSDASLAPDFGLSAHQRRVFSFAHHSNAGTFKPIDSMRIGSSLAAKAHL